MTVCHWAADHGGFCRKTISIVHPTSEVNLLGKDPKKQQAEGTLEKAKGRAREAAGALTGDQKQKAKGQVEQAKGEAKKNVGKARENVRKKI